LLSHWLILWLGAFVINRETQDELVISGKTQDYARQVCLFRDQIDGKSASRKGQTSFNDM